VIPIAVYDSSFHGLWDRFLILNSMSIICTTSMRCSYHLCHILHWLFLHQFAQIWFVLQRRRLASKIAWKTVNVCCWIHAGDEIRTKECQNLCSDCDAATVEEIRKRAREDKSHRAPLVALFLVCGDRLLARHRPTRPTMCLLSSFSPIFCRVAVQPSSHFDTPISRWVKIPPLRFFPEIPPFSTASLMDSKAFIQTGGTYLFKQGYSVSY